MNTTPLEMDTRVLIDKASKILDILLMDVVENLKMFIENNLALKMNVES